MSSKEYHRQYYLANAEKLKAASRARRALDPEACNRRAAAWAAEHPERIAEINAAWTKRNAGYARYQANKRRAAKLRATPSWADADAMLVVYEKALELHMDVDHIVPLQGRLVCGLHVHANLQLLHPALNRSKGNSSWPDMP